MNRVLRPVVSVDDLLQLDPLDRLRTLIGGDNFDPRLRKEPITFDIHDPIYGYRCGIQGCVQHSTQATWWCNKHSVERLTALRNGIGEAQWKARAVPYAQRQPAVATDRRCRRVDSARTGTPLRAACAADTRFSTAKPKGWLDLGLWRLSGSHDRCRLPGCWKLPGRQLPEAGRVRAASMPPPPQALAPGRLTTGPETGAVAVSGLVVGIRTPGAFSLPAYHRCSPPKFATDFGRTPRALRPRDGIRSGYVRSSGPALKPA